MLDMDDAEIETPPSMEPELLAEMKRRLERAEDPTTGKKLAVGRVYAAFEPDGRGLVEVLYMTPSDGPAFVNGKKQPETGQPMTAFLRGLELAYLVEGW